MEYINIDSESASVQDVPKGYPTKITVLQYLQIYSQSIPRHNNGFDHHN